MKQREKLIVYAGALLVVFFVLGWILLSLAQPPSADQTIIDMYCNESTTSDIHVYKCENGIYRVTPQIPDVGSTYVNSSGDVQAACGGFILSQPPPCSFYGNLTCDLTVNICQ